jgi:CHAT domain-containing protein/tetratricopeptide (TPR) repeat protein
MDAFTSLYPPSPENGKRFFCFFSFTAKSFFFLLFLAYSSQAAPQPDARNLDSLRSLNLLNSGYSYLLSEKYDSAATAYAEALELCRNLGSLRRTAYCLNALAECHLRKEEFDSAHGFLLDARAFEEKFLPAGSSEEARSQYLLGLVLGNEDRLTEAVEAFEKAIAVYQRMAPDDSVMLASCDASLADTWKSLGRFDAAVRHVDRGAGIFSRAGVDYQNHYAQALLTSGAIKCYQGEYDSAITILSRSLSLLQGQGTNTLKSIAMIYLGSCYARKGDYAKAVEMHREALGAYKEGVAGKTSLGGCYMQLGEQYFNLGDYEKAIDYLTQAMQVIKSSLNDKHRTNAEPLELLGRTYLALGQTEKALDFTNQSIAIRENALGSRHPALRFSYETKGDILRKTGSPRQALDYYGKALEISEAMNGNRDSYAVVRILILMGSTEIELGRFRQADSILSLAFEQGARSSTRSPVQMAAAYLALGDLLDGQAKYAGAAREYQRSIMDLCTDFSDTSLCANPSPLQVRNAKEIIPVLAAKGRALQKMYVRGERDRSYLLAALNSCEAALNIGDEAVRSFTNVDSKLFHEEEISSVQESAIDLATKLFLVTHDSSYEKHALELAECARAQVLLQNITQSHVEHFGGIPDSVLQRELALRADANSCDILIDRALAGMDSVSPERLSNLQARRFAARERMDHLDGQMMRDYPGYHECHSGQTAFQLGALQRLLGPQTALVEYFCGKSNLYIFLVKAGSLRLVTVPGKHLPGEVEGIRTALKSIDPVSFVQHSTRLYQTLLAPIRTDLRGVNKLVIVPDGTLSYLPFEALLESAPGKIGEKEMQSGKLPYLLKSFDLSYSYSASFFATFVRRNDGRESSPRFAGFAPVFSDSTGNAALLASNFVSRQADTSAIRSITVDGKRFNELKYSEMEIQSIGENFRRSGVSVAEFLHGSATEEAFKRNAGRSKFVHVATHGLMNGENPRLSGLLFAPESNGGTDDGILYAGETYNLKLDADLLVLSSCESGLGKLARGEGVMSITRGFFYAGARNIVVSLWRIYDKQTSQFMQEFYKHILDGESYAGALRQAKLRMIEDPLTSFPSKWAGFVLLGR